MNQNWDQKARLRKNQPGSPGGNEGRIRGNHEREPDPVKTDSERRWDTVLGNHYKGTHFLDKEQQSLKAGGGGGWQGRGPSVRSSSRGVEGCVPHSVFRTIRGTLRAS